jgi:D-glycero-D-manno-heptose 1,7-bisphosphate phosphatase
MKLVILDRDGVISRHSDHFIGSPNEWEPIAGSLEAIARLTRAGWRVVVATNQSGIGRGLFDMDALTAINDKMTKAAAVHGGRIDAVFFCPHAASDECDCRKPKPGMLREIEVRLNADMSQTPVIGDGLRDIEAAIAVGALPMLVLTGKGKKTLRDPALPAGIPTYPDLAAAVDHLLQDEDA